MHIGGVSTFAKEVVVKLVERALGSSLPLASSVGFDTFEKMKHIFSIAPVGSLEKLQECFLLGKHSPDAVLGDIRHCTGCALHVR